jgi:hypothetical protein
LSARAEQIELEGEMVQGASQVLNHVADNQTDIGRNIAHRNQIIDKASRLWIASGSDFVGAGIQKGFEPKIEVNDVLFGPFNLKSDER